MKNVDSVLNLLIRVADHYHGTYCHLKDSMSTRFHSNGTSNECEGCIQQCQRSLLGSKFLTFLKCLCSNNYATGLKPQNQGYSSASVTLTMIQILSGPVPRRDTSADSSESRI